MESNRRPPADDLEYSIEAADQRFMDLNGSHNPIPKGSYCYTALEPFQSEGNALPRMRVKLCPYWASNPNVHRQESGYCAFLKVGDWQPEGTSLLWDQVKECNVNFEWEDD